jgi:hypothetical protein
LQVNPLPAVAFVLSTDTVCSNGLPINLTGGSPAGGTYSGTGVVSNRFDPITAGAGLHEITYTVVDGTTGCENSATQLIYVDPCAGIEAINSTELSVFPNPVVNQLTIEIPGMHKDLIVELYTMLGDRIARYAMPGEQLHIDFSDLPMGVYQVSMRTSNGVISRRVVKLN